MDLDFKSLLQQSISLTSVSPQLLGGTPSHGFDSRLQIGTPILHKGFDQIEAQSKQLASNSKTSLLSHVSPSLSTNPTYANSHPSITIPTKSEPQVSLSPSLSNLGLDSQDGIPSNGNRK